MPSLNRNHGRLRLRRERPLFLGVFRAFVARFFYDGIGLDG
jgi:hypothetical protein